MTDGIFKEEKSLTIFDSRGKCIDCGALTDLNDCKLCKPCYEKTMKEFYGNGTLFKSHNILERQ